MADVMTPQQRRKNMQAIKSVSKLESIVSKKLWNKGYRFRRNTKNLMGRPDISIKKYNIVIFIDSCFWHQCPLHGKIPKTNESFWKPKLERNIKRDKEVDRYYREKGWQIKRIWEHEVKEDIDEVIDGLSRLIDQEKRNK